MKKRFFLLIVISLISLGLVTVTLVAAGVAQDKGQSPSGSAPVIPPQANPPNLSYLNQIASSSNPNSGSFTKRPAEGQTKPTPPPTVPDNSGERMRQQAMSVQPTGVDAVNRFEFWLNSSGWTNMWGEVTTATEVTVWLPREPFSLTSSADPSCSGCFNFPEHAILYPGDVVTVTTSAGDPPVIIQIHDPLEAHADALTGQVWGQIGDWYTREVEVHTQNGYVITTTATDGVGNFMATWPEMQRGDSGYIRFVDQVDSTSVIFHRPFYDLEPRITVDYADDWIEEVYEAGHTVWITLTNATGGIKATASGETGSLDIWGGTEGWSTPANMLWDGLRPDIQPGDHVSVRVDNGRTGEVHLPEITGEVDVAADTVSGNLVGDWLTGTVYVGCAVWGPPNAPGMGTSATPPDYPYLCDFGGSFDILPGMNVAVDYREADNDQVFNIIHQAAPNLWINIWGEGTPASGGNYILHVQYNNGGDALAPNVVITSTLKGMEYITDTSGLSHTGTGDPLDPLVWQVGDLEPYGLWWGTYEYYIFVRVVNPPGAGLFTDARIRTNLTYYQNENDKYASWGYDPIPELNVDVSVGKWAWTGDPAPGNDFVYDVSVCNNGNTSSDWVVLTDTLPLSTTLVDWWGSHPGWEEVTRSAHELVVTRPTIQDHWCGDVWLQVHLDETAWPGMPQLLNVADVWTNNDTNPDNNHTETWLGVGQPHPNLALSPGWVTGQHVPGGSYNYELIYTNNGNVPLDDVLLTSTLPAGTIFVDAYGAYSNIWYSYPPDVIVSPTLTQDGYAVWNIGHLENGVAKLVGVELKIDSASKVGDPLNVQLDISPQPWEDRYDDNTLRYQNQVNAYGPNLRIDKHTNWNWEQPGPDEYLINHELRMMNLGSRQLENVWITDTLPAHASLDSWWRDHGPDGMNVSASDGMVVFYVPELRPGDTASFYYRIRFEPGTVHQGMAFTDWMEAPYEGDVNPADNYDTVTAYSGPDVYVRKYLSGGIPEPGAIITFTVEFGNQNRWPWNSDDLSPNPSSLVIDSLPEGMTFITATAPGTPGEHWSWWLKTDNTFIWKWGPMQSQTLWWYKLVVQLDADLAPGQVLTNTIEAYGLSSNNIDPDPSNNRAECTVTIPHAGVTLAPPSQAASASPGSMVTYTFTLTNTSIVADTFAISATGVWTTSLSTASSGVVQPGDSFTFSLQVTVPDNVLFGDQDITHVLVQSGYEPTVQASADVTTTAFLFRLWLPFIIR